MWDSVAFSASQLLVIVIVVGLTEKFKDIVSFTNRRWYTLVALGFSVLFGFLSPESGGTMREIGYSIALYFAGSVIFYDTVLKWIEAKRNSIASSEED